MNKNILWLIGVLILVLISVTVISCDNNNSSTGTHLEKAGRWNCALFNGNESVPDWKVYFDPEGGIADITAVTAPVNGKNYLFLNAHALDGRYNGRIMIFDIQDPLSPHFIATISPVKQEHNGVQINSIAVSGNTLYGGLFGDKGLWMVDISDPAHPKDLGIAPLAMTKNLVVSGNYAYAMSQMDYNLTISDIADTKNAREITRIQTGSRDDCLVVSGNLLFSGFGTKLTVYDVSIPSSPKQIGTCELALTGNLTTELAFSEKAATQAPWANWANIIDLQASGSYVYATFGAGQLRVIDVSNPAAPHEVTSVNTGGFAIALTLQDNKLYMTKSDTTAPNLQLCILDISKPEKPEVLDTALTESDFGFGGATFAYCFARPQVSGDHVYVSGFNYFDVFKIR